MSSVVDWPLVWCFRLRAHTHFVVHVLRFCLGVVVVTFIWVMFWIGISLIPLAVVAVALDPYTPFQSAQGVLTLAGLCLTVCFATILVILGVSAIGMLA